MLGRVLCTATGCLMFAAVGWSADSQGLPTTPVVPPLQLVSEPPGRTTATPFTSRIHIPPTERKRLSVSAEAPAVASPMPVSMPTAESPAGVRSLIPGSPVKAWLFFHPTTGHALPLLRPRPYVGQVAGSFPCTSAPDVIANGNDGCCSNSGRGRRDVLPAMDISRDQATAKPTPTPRPPAAATPPGYRYAVSVHPKVYEQLLTPVQRSAYTPASAGFWNTPAELPKLPEAAGKR